MAEQEGVDVFTWSIKGVQFSRADLKNYDTELLLTHFWRNYGSWLRKWLDERKLQIEAEDSGNAGGFEN